MAVRPATGVARGLATLSARAGHPVHPGADLATELVTSLATAGAKPRPVPAWLCGGLKRRYSPIKTPRRKRRSALPAASPALGGGGGGWLSVAHQSFLISKLHSHLRYSFLSSSQNTDFTW